MALAHLSWPRFSFVLSRLQRRNPFDPPFLSRNLRILRRSRKRCCSGMARLPAHSATPPPTGQRLFYTPPPQIICQPRRSSCFREGVTDFSLPITKGGKSPIG